ncbi:MAG: histidinol-phosphatase HisJ family protein [Desulfobacteraceae bacterium]|nr:histidinol-phosphatase HisJ family protein [Desulfobacterales bacterium]MBL6966819.1 histidinol-phosphatase HisJ family protein [Desulfobacteraceae bacterium]MBL7101884.1 histidinol-phosphatase HisJ family protein [Desulfobacteraceae bacterium]MBL7172239.1 histidinol-phosphatase HisJ family protein [Desulfobacteraceae bacterium]MBU0990367.1 histidinol-phosphatase HisJ family protein [Pseudomonadota bacterium]
MNMLPDYHIHTALCKHAQGGVGEYRSGAKKQGIPEICFADHAPNPDGYDPAHRMTLNQFPSYKAGISMVQDGEPPGVLLGLEADYYEGCERFLSSWLPDQGFDFVLGSVHFINGWGFDNPEERHIWDSADVTATWRRYFEVVTRLVDCGLFDAVGHLDLPKKFGYRPSDRDLKDMVRPVLDRMARAGMGIELNTSGLRKPVGEIYPSPMIVSLARERGIPVCFGSDAHSPGDVGDRFALALDLAREAGYTEYFRIRQRKKELAVL